MRQRPRSRRGLEKQDPVGLSGWLYTDLLLGLMIVFLGSVTFMVAGDRESVSAGEEEQGLPAGQTSTTTLAGETTTTASTTSTTTSPVETTTLVPTTTVSPGVESCFFRIQLGAWISAESMAESFRGSLVGKGIGGQEVGIILTFGDTEGDEANTVGTSSANKFNSEVLPLLDVTKRAASRDFFTQSARYGHGFKLDLYLMAGADWPAHFDEDENGECDPIE